MAQNAGIGRQGRRRAAICRGWLSLALACVGACAPALPTMSGGGNTPLQSVDIATGGATRVLLGGLRAGDERVDPQSGEEGINPLGYIQPGGVSPLVLTRFPLAERLDLALCSSGSTGELHLRHGFVLGEGINLMGSVAPYAGWLLLRYPWDDERSSNGASVGANTPWVVAINLGGIYEAWFGVRAGLEHAWGRFEHGENARERSAFYGTGIRAGALLGLGVGFRRVHALMELTADHEWWQLGGDPGDLNRSGFSLTPAFALRLRI